MLTSSEILTENINTPAGTPDFVAAAKSQFIAFFQSKGFTCTADALQQIKATCNKLTVRFSVSDAQIAADQGHAVCYLSFAPLNRRYKIAVSNVEQASATGNTYTYTLLEDTFARTASARHTTNTFYSLEELLDTIFPKATSFSGARTLQSFLSLLF